MGFIAAHGGVIATILLVMVVYNGFFSFLATVFTALGKQEPAWMKSAGAWGLKVTQWLSANTPSPK